MLFVSREQATISQRHQLLWKLKQKVNKSGWITALFQFRGCLWTNVPAIYWAPPAGKWLCVSKSSSCKKFKFCEWKKDFKMFLTNLLAWEEGISIYTTAKINWWACCWFCWFQSTWTKRISSVKTSYEIAWSTQKMSKNLWSAIFSSRHTKGKFPRFVFNNTV